MQENDVLYTIDMGTPIPDMGYGDWEPTSQYVAVRSEFVGIPEIGAKVKLITGSAKNLNQHLEGVERREMLWLDGKVGSIVAIELA